MAEIELNFEMDPVERIQIEIEHTINGMLKCIGNYLLEQFQKDEVLKNCYKDRKITLEAIDKYLTSMNKKNFILSTIKNLDGNYTT